MSEVLLGVFDGYMPLSRDALTSETKIGGTPTYLPALCDSHRSTMCEWTTCGVCGHQMFLVMQAFSPLPMAPALHHRMVYVFCCNSAVCVRQPSSSWCAFSVQVDAADEEALQDDASDDIIHVDPLTAAELPPNTFPPCYVAVVPEPRKEVVVPTDVEAEMIRAAEENARNPDITEGDMRELEQTFDLKDKPSDYNFEKFRRKMAREPAQVLRYYPRSQVGSQEATTTTTATTTPAAVAQPIFMNRRKVHDIVRVPPCSSCGAALIHELQIMPTSIYYMRVGEYVTTKRSDASPPLPPAAAAAAACGAAVVDEGVDWGTVTVFVCSKDCSRDMRGVVLRREFLIVEKAPELQDEISEAKERKNLRSLMT